MHPPFAWPCCVLPGLCHLRKVLVNNDVPWCEEEDQESDEFCAFNCFERPLVHLLEFGA